MSTDPATSAGRCTIAKAVADQLLHPGRGKGCLLKIFPTEISHGPIELPNGRFVMGRGLGCDMVLHDESVSREHVAIEFRADGYLIRDLRSTNGTFVNEARVTERLLRDGDRVRVGGCIFKFLAGNNLEAQYHEQVYSMMISDALTGVHNKWFLMESLKRELIHAHRRGHPLSLVLFDLDHFKKINDVHGHLVGDFVLREVTSRIRPRVRGDEVFARYGGEEFAIVLPETALDDAIGFADRLRAIVADTPVNVHGVNVDVTISIGIAVYLGDTEIEPDELIAAADNKLYQAKRTGRNRVSA